MQSLTLESATEKTPGWVAQLAPRLHAKAFTGGLIVLTFIVVGILGPALAPSDPNKQELTAMTKAPEGIGSLHVLGTDNLGRDVLSRVIYGARVSLLVAFAVVFISGFIGISLGAISGYFGGKVDFVIQTSLVIGTFAMASAIIAEASLSFLGVGVPPDIPTWGTMLADARIYISTAWWLPLFPGLCIFVTVLGINLLGDALRDLLDPRLKRASSGILETGVLEQWSNGLMQSNAILP